jgi:sortase A
MVAVCLTLRLPKSHPVTLDSSTPARIDTRLLAASRLLILRDLLFRRRRAPTERPWFRRAEFLFCLIGIGLLSIFLGAELHSLLFSRIALLQFDAAKAKQNGKLTGIDLSTEAKPVDFSLWGEARIKAYRASLALKLDPPIAVLRIPKLHLTAPIFNGTDDVTLNRGVGRIQGTTMPGEGGNFGVAGHRDGFFRGLKDIAQGDLIEVDMPGEKDTYVVESMQIVEPKDVGVLEPWPVATITLVTCYPFYFVGDAPQRFIVKASLRNRDLLQQARTLMPEPQ